MGKRREGREAAVQFLFYRDLNHGVTLDSLADFWDLRPAGNGVQAFARPIIAGVIEQQTVIDQHIIKYTANYDLHRISTVDRNILRVAIYEMFFRGDIPPIVSINEAIEIAKKFGTEESGRFVNGVLDRVKLELSRPLREAAGEAPDEPKAQPAASTGRE